jgi:hypothetical protein
LELCVREVTYTIRHLDMGGWITTVTEEGDMPRPLAVTARPESEGAVDVLAGIFKDLGTRDRRRREGSLIRRADMNEEPDMLLCQAFVLEHLQSVSKGEAASFKEHFMHRWLSRRNALSRKEANKAPNRRRSVHLTKVQPN